MEPTHTQPASGASAPNLCFVGFGEVTRTWITSLTAAGYPRSALQVLYLNHGDAGVAAARARAVGYAVDLVLDPRAIRTDTDLLLHATSATALPSVFGKCLPSLRRGQLWVDVVSTAASAKERIAAEAATAGVDFVDAAMMGAAWKLGHRAALWICGPGRGRFTEWANAWGTPVVDVGPAPGTAARVKMCRSVTVKGFAAVLVEGLLLAEMNGVTDSVLQCMRDDFGNDMVELVCTRFIPGSMRHGERRAAEMKGSQELADETGWNSITIGSTARLLEFIAKSGGRELAAESSDYRELLRGLAARLHPSP